MATKILNEEDQDCLESNAPEIDDTETLKADHESLELLVHTIIANKRLASKIVQAWMTKHDQVMAPREWLESRLGVPTTAAARAVNLLDEM
jgi:hypothetical protein